MAKGFGDLERDVIKRGLCTACGTCIGVCPRGALEYDPFLEEPVWAGGTGAGDPTPAARCRDCGVCYRCCPGLGVPAGEIEKMVFPPGEAPIASDIFGRARILLKGHACDQEVRDKGTSGGLVTALMQYALEKGTVGRCMLAGMSRALPWRAEPRLACDAREAQACAGSKYTVVPTNATLSAALKMGAGGLAMAGLPCQVDGIRMAQSRYPGMIKNPLLVVGIFCGTNWPATATESFIRRVMGVELENVASVEYRGGQGNNQFRVVTADGRVISRSVADFMVYTASHRRDRCLVCTRFAAEYADLSVGDIFLPGSAEKLPGWSAVLVRTRAGEHLVRGAGVAGYIVTEELDPSDLAFNRGIQHKKVAAAARLEKRRSWGWPTPEDIK